MIAYIIRRLLWSVVLLFAVSLIAFLIFVLMPAADPAILRAGRNPSPEIIAAIREQLGLDKPWYVQYGIYMRDLILHFDFGYSYQNNIAVRETIFDRLPATISLAIAPVYWVGLVSIYLFSEDLGKLLPIFKGAGQYTPFTDDPVAWFTALILPWLVLATAFAAIYARFLRANLLDVMGEDYIRTARAKGLGERRVVFRHGLRSAITPIVTIFGLDLGILIGGAILTETVFNIPGIGRLAFDSIQKSDLPIVQGTVLIAALAIIIMNLIVDILYAFLDPRVRY